MQVAFLRNNDIPAPRLEVKSHYKTKNTAYMIARVIVFMCS